MSYEAIGRRWATAIFELGKESGQLTILRDQIAGVANAYQVSEELRHILDNPLVPTNEQALVLDEIASRIGASETAKSTLKLLLQKRRLAALPEISRALNLLVDEDTKVLRAEVTSAGPLSQDYLDKLSAELERATGRKVVIVHRQDKSLIGGVVTKIGDRVIDGSIRARLAAFRDQLLRA